MSIQNVKLRVTQGYSRIGYQQWENTVIPIYWSRDVHAPGKIFFFSTHEFQAGLRTRFIVQNVSKLPSVDILVMTNIDTYAIAVLEMRASKILESLA